MLTFASPFDLLVSNKPFTSITVDNVMLTLNYYKEYLGSKIINNSIKKQNIGYAIIELHNKKIMLQQEAINSSIVSGNEVSFELNYDDSQMKLLYNNYKQKLRIVRSLNKNEKGVSEFSVIDCNGVILKFRGCIDYQLESYF